MKKVSIAVIVFLMLPLMLTACNQGAASSGVESSEPAAEISSDLLSTDVNLGVIKGPSGVSMAKLLYDNDTLQGDVKYNLTLAAAPDEITAKLSSSSLDIAVLPLNIAANLYNKTNGSLKVAAISGLGNIFVLAKEDIKSVADLEDKTVLVAGQGATPEYVVRHLLKNKGISDKVTLNYKAPSEAAADAIAGNADIVVLPEPFVSQVTESDSAFKTVLDLNKEWEVINGNQSLIMTCVVVRTEFLASNGEAVDSFLNKFKESVDFCNDDIDDTAVYAETYEIMDASAVKKAIPKSAITFIKGQDMKTKIDVFLNILLGIDPKSIGEKVPDENFYYIQ